MRYNDIELCVFFYSDLVNLKNSSFLCNAKNGAVIGTSFQLKKL